MSDSSDSELPAPSRSKTSKSSTSSLVPRRDSQLSKLIKKHQEKRDREDTARIEANANRVAAMDGKVRKGKVAIHRPPPPPNPAHKPLGTLVWFIEGAEAFDNAPLPSKNHVATLKLQGFSISAAKRDELQVSRSWTHKQCLAFLKEKLPIPYTATAAAIDAWKEAYPDEEAPPFFRVLSQTNKRLSVSPSKEPTGADLQEMFTNASNWYDKRLYITSGIDISLYPEDEVDVYRPCVLRAELDAATRIGDEDQEDLNASSDAEEDGRKNADAEDEDEDEYEAPPATLKRKHARDDSPPVTRSMKRPKHESHVINISDDDNDAPIAGPSSVRPAYAVSTLIVTGFNSPPKRNRARVAEGPQ